MSWSQIIAAIVAAALVAIITTVAIHNTGWQCHFGKPDFLSNSNFLGDRR